MEHNKRKKESPESITPEETNFINQAEIYYYSLIPTNPANKGKALDEIVQRTNKYIK